MKTPFILRACRTVFSRLLLVTVALLLVFSLTNSRASDITISNSIVTLATAGTNNYTFTDPNTGASAVIAVTMKPYSSDPADIITFLDGNTRLGVGNPDIGGDGNWIESTEGVDFGASLVSISGGALVSSVKFRIAGLGIRPYATINWTSSADATTFHIPDGTESVYTLDSDLAPLNGTNYYGHFRLSGLSQLTDSGPLGGQSLVLNATFSSTNINISTGSQVGGNPVDAPPSLSFIDSNRVALAANLGGTDLVRDGISFAGVTNTTNPSTNTFGSYTLTVVAPGGTLAAATFGDDLFGSFIWADNQNEMGVKIDGLDSNKIYTAYYLAGDDRALGFNMVLTSTATTEANTNSSEGAMIWGSGSLTGQKYIYLPVTVSGATSLTATMAKVSFSSGVGMSGVILVEGTSANHPPTLTAINALTNATEDTAFSIDYTTLKNASDAVDADGNAISFRIESVNSGVLRQNGTNITAGTTLLSVGQSVVWTPAADANGTLNAFSVRAWDGTVASSTAVQVNVDVAAVNDAPAVYNPIPTQSATYGSFFSYTISDDTFIDVDTPTLTYYFNPTEALPSPQGLSFDQATHTLSGIPTVAGQCGGMVGVSDGDAGTSTEFIINIAKASLIVTPVDITRAYGQNNPTLTGTVSGIKNGDTITATYTTTATAASPAGTYPITFTLSDPSGRLGNYFVTTNQATLTITNVPVAYVLDARTNSWMTNSSGKYARIYKTKLDQTNGVSSTTWSNTFNQAVPVYAGIQEVYSSTNWAYVRASGLSSHIMGPWYLDVNKTQLFPQWPVNQKSMFRIPRTPTVATNKTLTSTGAIGWFVDGVAMFDDEDSYYWNGTTETNQGASYYWYRDAYVNEGPSFDPNNAHQEQTGTHHYHANPPALRFLLNDNVLFNANSKTYSENSTNTNIKHSPIIGWMRDGLPLYGPYGYSVATNANSGVRRMISGFVLRNGQNNTDNLTSGRTGLPAWALRLYGATNNHTGPAVNGQYPIGHYLEDSAYLGDVGYTQGVDFDLDEYNGRFCVTPEFPGGTYAYFCSIQSNGTPKMPYNIGRAYYGIPSGGSVSMISETVVTNFLGGTNLTAKLKMPQVQNNTVTLTWSAIEGGTYQVDASTNFPTWTSIATGISANQTNGAYTNATALSRRFYRVARTSVANSDSVGTTLFGTASVAPGGSAPRGATVTVTITLPDNPPQPPANVVPTTVTLGGTISGTLISRPSQGTVQATFTIPVGASTGAKDIQITFNPAPTYSLTGAFTIN